MRPAGARQGSTRRCTSYQASNCAARSIFPFCFGVRGDGILAPWPKRPRTNNPKNRPGGAPAQTLSAVMPALAGAAAFARAGFSDPTLVLRWAEIAGADTARIARPIKFTEGPSGGVLTLMAEPGAALFLQHEFAIPVRAHQCLSRPAAVARLKFVQGALTLRPSAEAAKPSEPPSCDPARKCSWDLSRWESAL